MRRQWIAFAPYLTVSIVHVGALALGADAIAGPTKLALMPLLALAVVWGGRGTPWTTARTLLLTAIGLSWIGDGAATFFPWLETVPMMLLFFGLAHVCYIALFWRLLAMRRVPAWAVVYAVWWGVLLAVLWPHLGGLLIAVAVYGLVLGGTAVAASRCHPLIAWGGAFFLASDTILAFRLFLPEATPDWTSPAVMFTYCLGQGLIAAGVLVSTRVRRPEVVAA
ncbi:lysoplasmalogenase [Microbacterium sp. HD4P20]|uniref:lysoplasmalogenase n=1 Tax=Microbacterium sp. HD4P20 TaxID=2864874 RepID=UPI001C6413AF|nr:lysoplasmalogenase [Microbacterium sp. HD4P20]MCP2637204.1 lysoplasmalogenase [Microbacterium sp. HD4P20]